MKKLIKKITPRYILCLAKQAKNFSILARDYGQFQTINKWSCLDKTGKPIPWYSYPAIEYLSHLDFSGFKVLEYGSGNSTLWWAERCAAVVSIEHDEQWYNRISVQNQNRNINYILEQKQDNYVRQATLADMDIVVIDGKNRARCAEYLIQTVKHSPNNLTMVVFDNSDWYPKTIQKLNEQLGWAQVDFHGFTPINAYTATTSIFINPKLVNKIKYKKPLMSVRGIVENSINNPDDEL